jgi:hypothetical protein
LIVANNDPLDGIECPLIYHLSTSYDSRRPFSGRKTRAGHFRSFYDGRGWHLGRRNNSSAPLHLPALSSRPSPIFYSRGSLVYALPSKIFLHSGLSEFCKAIERFEANWEVHEYHSNVSSSTTFCAGSRRTQNSLERCCEQFQLLDPSFDIKTFRKSLLSGAVHYGISIPLVSRDIKQCAFISARPARHPRHAPCSPANSSCSSAAQCSSNLGVLKIRVASSTDSNTRPGPERKTENQGEGVSFLFLSRQKHYGAAESWN